MEKSNPQLTKEIGTQTEGQIDDIRHRTAIFLNTLLGVKIIGKKVSSLSKVLTTLILYVWTVHRAWRKVLCLLQLII